MTQTLHEAMQPEGPVGSIFLPELRGLTLPELDKMKFAVMQLRGSASELTLDDQERIYEEILALEESIRARDSELGGVALLRIV